jgi:hypothetical protein
MNNHRQQGGGLYGYTLSIGFLFDTVNEVLSFVVYAYISSQTFAGC